MGAPQPRRGDEAPRTRLARFPTWVGGLTHPHVRQGRHDSVDNLSLAFAHVIPHGTHFVRQWQKGQHGGLRSLHERRPDE